MNPIRRETISEWSEKAWKENRCVLDFLSQQQPLVHQNPVVLTVIVLFTFRIKSHFSANPIYHLSARQINASSWNKTEAKNFYVPLLRYYYCVEGLQLFGPQKKRRKGPRRTRIK